MIDFNVQVDESSVKKADSSGGITEKGMYVGTFTKVELIQAQTGTLGVEFDFKTNDDIQVKGMKFWIQKADGTKIFGLDKLMALASLLGVPTLKPTTQNRLKYDYDAKTEITKDVKCFVELENKPIGVLLFKEEYEWEGNIKFKMSIEMFFDAQTKQNAKEKLEKKEAQIVERRFKSLKDKLLAPQTNNYPQTTSDGVAEINIDDDDIPF